MSAHAVDILTNVAIIVGLLAFLSAHFLRTPDAPRGFTWNPKRWKPIWKTKRDFRAPGFQLLIGSYLIFAVAVVMRIAVLGWPCW